MSTFSRYFCTQSAVERHTAVKHDDTGAVQLRRLLVIVGLVLTALCCGCSVVAWFVWLRPALQPRFP